MTKARDLSKGVFDTDTLVVDGANNRVGIGTDSPDSQLEVSNTGQSNIKVTNSTNSTEARIIADNGQVYVQSQTNHPLNLGINNGVPRLQITTGGDLKARAEGGSGLNIDLRQGSAKFWVQYYHVSGTPTAQDSFNVSSLTDRGTGRVDIVINNNMNNANYAGGGLAGHDSGTGSSGKTAQLERQTGNPTRTTAVAVQTVYDPSPSISDVTGDSRAQFVFHGDLA
jgi:hypothetical protein